MKEVEVKPWALNEGLGALINLDGTGGTNDAYVCEIPPGKKLKPQKHLFEEMIYVAKGNGATTVWQKDGAKHTFEWHAGSLFAIPINASYQHFNGSGTESVRLFAVTNAPFMINLFHNLDFIFDNDFSFKDRFDPADTDYFSREGTLEGRFFLTTNFVPNTHTIELKDYKERGARSRNIKFDLAGQVMCAHISEFPVGTYKKAHRHGPGAHVIVLGGKGFSVLWPEEGRADSSRLATRVRGGSAYAMVPPAFSTPVRNRARYLALRWNSFRYKFIRLGDNGDAGSAYTSVKDGGGQIEYEDEDPAVHREFEALVSAAGAKCQMGDVHPGCTER